MPHKLDENKNYLQKRLEKLFEGGNFDAILLYNTEERDSNFLYLTGFRSGVFEYTPLVATRDSVHVFASQLEYDTAISQAGKGGAIEVHHFDREKDFKSKIGKMLKGKVVGVDYSFLPYSEFRRLKKISGAKRFVDVSKAFGEARAVKDKTELALMKKAIDITRYAFENVEESFARGMSEVELAGKFEYLLRERGAEGLAFSTIVSFGSNAALPHHMPDQTKLRENEFVLIDAGAKYGNYCADMTRTFIFRPDVHSTKYKKMKEIIEVVERAHDGAIELMHEGEIAKNVHEYAANFIDSFGRHQYKGTFIHSLGHSIGIDVHDGFGGIGIYPGSKTVLKRGMVFSDEPGIYITGFGGARIEDDILIGKKKGIMLSGEK